MKIWRDILARVPGPDRLAGLAMLLVVAVAVVVLTAACGSKIGLTVDTPPAQEVVLRPSASSSTMRDRLFRPNSSDCSLSEPLAEPPSEDTDCKPLK